ncbi:O-fucosyltransferase 10-like [Mercurialis annua]|uniref:O-fucosyltransferase 10-like n=1 Tax=Mercurialis annua TaxID=3986 RepID=UPI00215FBEA9|nr:O-fucosyltransferase 10-like [Mercurialis annua]
MAINTATKTKPLHNSVNAVNNNASCCGGPAEAISATANTTTDSNNKSRRRLRSYKSDHFRRENLSAGIFLRWNLRYLLVLPLLYVSGLIMCIGPFSSLLFQPDLPGAVYRSHDLFVKLWPDILADNSTSIQLSSVWKYKRRLKVQRPCPNSTNARQSFPANQVSAGPSGYLIVEANGGLNQQRSAICNAVALAGLLNAILVIPQFEFNSVWRDPSEFGDIYDQDYFISILEGYVTVVHELPDEVMERYDYNITNILSIRVQAWAPANYYMGAVYPILQEHRVIRIAPFANRLAMSLPPQIQLLRCIANYKALRFSSAISTLGHKLVTRMMERSSRTGGKYVSVHLRFEKDMVAFSCCVYDGGGAEELNLKTIRELEWKGKFKRKDRVVMPGLNRIEGKCPLTPLEVGMMLRGMGFDNNTAIYLASGKIYKAERHLAPLLQMFPLLYTKESLATLDELAPFEGYSSRLAALDYTVCLYSEVFVTTQGGNFPHFLMGQRRFLFDGHAKTIKPDKRKLVINLQDMEISWKAFKYQMEMMLVESDRKGLMVPRVRKINRKTSIYTYPLPECGCLISYNSSLKSTAAPDTLDSLESTT